MARRAPRLLTAGLVSVAAAVAVMPSLAHAVTPLSFAPFVVNPGTPPTLVDGGLPDPPDFDDDGFPDSFSGQQSTEISFGGPNPSTEPVPTSATFPYALGHGDFNGDGHADLIVSTLPLSFAGNSFAIVLGQGAGPGPPRAGFGAPTATPLYNPNRMQLRVYDVNLDGADDALVWDYALGQVVVSFGSTTTAPFTAPTGSFGTGGTFLDIRSADLDHDGYADMVVVDTPGPVGLATIYQGSPVGFTFITTLQLSSYAMTLGDVNSDSLIDIGTGGSLWALQVVAPPVDVPEVGLLVLLPTSAAGLFALAALAHRRRLRPL